jgi:hypothetical protein
MADDRIPFPDAPARYESISNIRIGGSKRLRHGRRIALKQQYRPVHRIRQRSAQHEFATFDRRVRHRQMLIAKLGSPFHVLRNNVVNQKVMHNPPPLSIRNDIVAGSFLGSTKSAEQRSQDLNCRDEQTIIGYGLLRSS